MKKFNLLYKTGLIVTSSIIATSSAFAALTFNTTSITSDGVLTLTGAGASTWDIGANLLSLQTTGNGAITTGSGLFTVGGNLTVSGILDVLNIDRSGIIAIGTSSATGITIGRSGRTVTFPGDILVSGVPTLGGVLDAINIDRPGIIAIGTSSATGITIGRSTRTVTFAGNILTSGTSTFSGVVDALNIDRSGIIAIGTSSATGITIGRSGQEVTFPGNASTTGTLTIGGGGTAIVKHLSATSSITFGVIASTTCSNATIAVTGANAGDVTIASPLPVSSGIDTVSSTWSAWTTANTVNVRACNPTFANTASVAAQTWRADVWQY